MLRLRTKEDVDRHAEQVLRKLMTEAERKQKFFQFAQLYMKLNEYESARRSLVTYLSQRSDSAAGYKLLGQAFEGLNQLSQALNAYETSIKYDPRQSSIIYKICELYLNKDVPFDPEKAQAALERGQNAFPHDPIMFSLKEKIMGLSNDAVNVEEFEKLLLSEVKARPNDLDLRIKLLKLYTNSDRVELAYTTAVSIETKKMFNSEVSWFQCVDFICENYKNKYPSKCNWEFYMMWLSALDRTCSHLLQQRGILENNDASCKALFKFDKVLFQGSHVKSNVEVYADFINHMSGQLVYHMAVELIKKTKTEPGSWNETKSSIGVLLLLATNWTTDIHDLQLLNLSDSVKKCCSGFQHHTRARFCQSGYTLKSMIQEAQSKKHFIDKINFLASGQWRNQIYQKLFRSIKDQEKDQQSHFILSPLFKDIPQKFPASADLKPSEFVESFEVTYNNRLESLVWLGLFAVTKADESIVVKEFHTKSFSNINFTSGNLSNCGVESLNQLDLDSFLYCTILFVRNALEEQKSRGFNSFENALSLPSEVSDYFLTDEMQKWWKLALKMVSGNLKQTDGGEKYAKNRFELMQGIEEIRGALLPLSLLISLARIFALRAEFESNENRKVCCDKRALHLWDQAVICLKGLSSKVVTSNYNRQALFATYPSENYSPEDLSRLLDEGRYFIGCHYMKIRLWDKALDILKTISTPDALFKQATIYEMMACDVSGSLRGDELTSELRSREAVLASKARECLRRANDSLPDPHHPLAASIAAKTTEIDSLLCRIEPDNGMHDGNGFALSMESLSVGSGDSPVAVPRYRLNRSKHFPASTPKALDYSSRANPAPSVDVSELINTFQTNNNMKLQQMSEQSRLILDRLDNMYYEQRTQRTLFDDLANKISKLEIELKAGFIDIKKDTKKPDAYNVLDEDDYSEDVTQMPTVNQYLAAMRGIQNASALYGTAMPPYFSPNQIYPGGFYGLPTAPGPLGDAPQLADLLRGNAASAGTLRSLPPHLQQSMVSGPICSMSIGLPLQTSVPTSTTPTIPPTASLNTPVTPATISGLQQSSLGPNNVVITTSDILPTTVPTTTPTLSVRIPPEHRLGTPAPASMPVSTATPVPHNFQIPMPSNFKLVEKSPVQDSSNDDMEGDLEVHPEHAEHDPLPNFKPIVPLPDEVEVRTGEESETVLCQVHAKLYRFVDKEWKERGTGPLKILKNEGTGKYRILMRRDIHKICANHFISNDLELIPFANTGRAWMWWAPDYSDETVQVEKLVAKFKTVEDSDFFKETFDKVKKEIMNSSVSSQKSSSGAIVAALQADTPSKTVTISTTPITKTAVTTSNKTNVSISISTTPLSNKSQTAVKEKPTGPVLAPPRLSLDAASPKPATDAKSTGPIVFGGITFTSPPKTIPEKTPEVKEAQAKPKLFANFSFGSTPNATGGTFSFGSNGLLPAPSSTSASAAGVVTTTTTTTTTTKSFGSFASKDESKSGLIVPKLPPGSWECSSCYLTNNQNATTCVSCSAPKKIILTSNKPLSQPSTVSSTLPPLTKQTNPGEWTCSDCYVTNKAESATCAACGAKNPSGSSQSAAAPAPVVSKFSFGIPPATTGVPSKPTSGFTFGIQAAATTAPTSTTQASSAVSSTHTPAQVFTFGSKAPPLMSTNTGSFGSSTFSFTMSTPATVTKHENVGSPGPALDDSAEVAPEDDEHMKGVHFEPVVALPDKVDVKTGEEDEEVIYSHRAKLFRYDDNPNQREWKERGVGDIKILRHRGTGKLRLLMRREPVMKLCLNHYITPEIEMKPKDNKSWFWYAVDFADGDVQKITENIQSFSIRFKTPDIAAGFKEAFEKAQKEVIEKGLSPQKGTSNRIPRSTDSKTEPEKATTDPGIDDEVIFISENVVTEELRLRAEALKLPPKFYSYLESSSSCPGCRGCENNNEECTEDKPKVELPTKNPPATGKPPFTSNFGSSGGLLFGNENTPAKTSTPTSKNTPNLFSGTGAGTPLFGGFGKSGDSVFGTPKQAEDSMYSGTPRGGSGTPIYFGSPNASIFGGTPNTSVFGTPSANVFGGTPKSAANSTPLSNSIFTGGSLFGSQSNQQQPSLSFSFASVPPKPSEEKSTPSSQPPTTAASVQSPTESVESALDSSTSTTSDVRSTDTSFKTSSTSLESTPIFGTTGNEVTFATLASTNQPSFLKSSNFSWAGAGASVFGVTPQPENETSSTSTVVNKSVEDEDEEGEEGVEDAEEHDPHFEPIIPLPNKIEVKSGEEDEDIVFTERCKLYRMDDVNKEWKERGIGNIKLLKHKEKGSYRLLMRREQVHKIVLNHLVTPDLAINRMTNSANSWCWCTMNLSQDMNDPQKEMLCVRFKNSQLANGFKAAVDSAQEELRSH